VFAARKFVVSLNELAARRKTMKRTWSDHAPLPLRLMLGIGLAYHGFPKLFTAQGHDSFAGMLQGMGFPAAEPLAWAVGAFEFFGGLMLIAGAFTALIAALGVIEMAVAMFMVHLPAGFNFMNITGTGPAGPTFGMPGYEVNLLYIAGFLALVIGGAGALSVDRLRGEGEMFEPEPTPVRSREVPERAWSGEPRPGHEMAGRRG
jgi:putative oxidoreductase